MIAAKFRTPICEYIVLAHQQILGPGAGHENHLIFEEFTDLKARKLLRAVHNSDIERTFQVAAHQRFDMADHHT